MKAVDRQGEYLLVLTGDRFVAAEPALWKPFGAGKTLDQFVEGFNQTTETRILAATPDLMRACACQALPHLSIRVIVPGQVDWSTANRLESNAILLLDLDSLDLHPRAFAHLQDQLCERRPVYHLLQVSQQPEARSLAGYFQARQQVVTPEEAIFYDPADFEAYLDRFAGGHERAWLGVQSNPYDVPCGGLYGDPHVHPRHGHFVNRQSEKAQSISRAYAAYHGQLAGIVCEARDVAMARGLDDRQAVNLGRGAAVQAFLLDLIAEHARRGPEHAVSMQAVGKSLFDMPVESPLTLGRLQQKVLVVVHLNPAPRRPTAAQRAVLAQLGFSEGVMTVLHYDRPEVWRKLNMLSAFVSVDSFEAQLPVWNGNEASQEMGFNEASFGVGIEESFSRSLDDYYQRPGKAAVLGGVDN